MEDIREDDFVDSVSTQDEPTVDAIEREARAEAGKPEYLDLTGDELNKIAVQEWRDQSVLRGPVIVPEWGRAGIFCKRLSYTEQTELVKVFSEHGYPGAFCYRALNSQGERIFPSIKFFLESMQNRWNVIVLERVVGDMSILCRSQLTDQELGKS